MLEPHIAPPACVTEDAFAALMEISKRPPVVFVEGRGSWLTDQEGKKYLDFIQGWAVNCLGHCPTAIVSAIKSQAEQLLNCSPAYYNAPMIRLAELVARYSGLHRTFFTNSGAEAIEGAIKLARKWGQIHRGGAYEIVTMHHGFHGRTLAAMSASGKAQWEHLFEPKVPGFRKVRLNDIEQVERAITANTVAVMLEPIQGEAGVFVASDAFLRDLRALTKRHGILLILDEIQTGIGRTGTLFAFQRAGVEPDVMVLAKGLGGGIPLGALVAHKDACCFAYGDQGGTFNGNAFATAVGCAVLEEIAKPGFLAGVVEAGAHLAKRLTELSQQYQCAEVRGRGLLLALNLQSEIGPQVVGLALQRGLLINAPRTDTLRFMPALTVTRQEIDRMIAILGEVLKEFSIATECGFGRRPAETIPQSASHPCRDSGVAMTAQIAIRPLRLDERAAWEPLWKGYLDFYRITAPQETYDATWARLHDPNEPMWLLGGYVDGKLVGIVHYIYHRSCWTIGDYCYLQDLFVAEGARKLGLGRALIEAVYEAARAAGASRVHWLTHETNAVARSLYDTLADRPGFIQYRKLF